MAQRSSCCIRVLAGLCILFCIIHAAFNITLVATYNDLTDIFQQVFVYITLAILVLILIVMLYGFFATSPGQEHHLSKFRNITAALMFLLFLSGLLHIIGQAKDVDYFYTICINGYQNPYANYFAGWYGSGGNIINDQYEYCQMIYNALLATYCVIWILHLLILFALVIWLWINRSQMTPSERDHHNDDRTRRSDDRYSSRDVDRLERHESGGVRSMRTRSRQAPVSILANTPAATRVKPAPSREARERDGRVKYSTVNSQPSTRQGGSRVVSDSRTRGPYRMSLGPDEHEETSIDLNEQTGREYADYLLPEIFSSAEAPLPESSQMLQETNRTTPRDGARLSRSGGNTITRETRYSSRYDTAR